MQEPEPRQPLKSARARLTPAPPYLQGIAQQFLNVRLLDPLTAYQVKGQGGIRPTAFLADSLLVRGRDPRTLEALAKVAAEAGFDLMWDPRTGADDALLERARLEKDERAALERVWVRRVRLVPAEEPAQPVYKPIDTWRLLQAYRVEVGDDRERLADVGLEHPASSDPYTIAPLHEPPLHELAPLHLDSTPTPPRTRTPAAVGVRRARVGRSPAGHLARRAPAPSYAVAARSRGPWSPCSTPGSGSTRGSATTFVTRDLDGARRADRPSRRRRPPSRRAPASVEALVGELGPTPATAPSSPGWSARPARRRGCSTCRLFGDDGRGRRVRPAAQPPAPRAAAGAGPPRRADPTTRSEPGRRRHAVAGLLPRAAGGRGLRRPPRTDRSSCSAATASRWSSPPATTPPRARSTRPRSPRTPAARSPTTRPSCRSPRSGRSTPTAPSRCSATTGPWVRYHRPGASLVSTMPDDVRRLARALQRGGQPRAASSAPPLDPDDFTCRVRGVERHLVRRARLRRPARRTRSPRRTPAATPTEPVALRRCGTSPESSRAVRDPRGPVPGPDAERGRSGQIETDRGETLVARASAAFARLPGRRPRRLRRPGGGDDAADVAHGPGCRARPTSGRGRGADGVDEPARTARTRSVTRRRSSSGCSPPTRREAWRVSRRSRDEASASAAVFGVDDEEADGPARRTRARPDEPGLPDDRQRRLWQHVQELPERCRQLIAVIAYADRPDYAHLAEALGMPVGCIGPTRGRCLAKLARPARADDPRLGGTAVMTDDDFPRGVSPTWSALPPSRWTPTTRRCCAEVAELLTPCRPRARRPGRPGPVLARPRRAVRRGRRDHPDRGRRAGRAQRPRRRDARPRR